MTLVLVKVGVYVPILFLIDVIETVGFIAYENLVLRIFPKLFEQGQGATVNNLCPSKRNSL